MIDCLSRRVVGWSMVDHILAELVVESCKWRSGTADHQPGRSNTATYTSWAFGHRPREAGLLGSMGSVGDCFDNSVAESF